MNPDTRTWIVLLVLTVLAFLLGERGTAGAAVLAVAAGKFGLVAWQFMDLRHAARVWSALMLVLLGLTLAAVVALR